MNLWTKIKLKFCCYSKCSLNEKDIAKQPETEIEQYKRYISEV